MGKHEFTFSVGVSTTCYTGKCHEWGKLRYQTQELDIDGLSDLIQQGYCFTHTFNDVSDDGTFGCKEKTIKNFKSTNTVFIDIDDCSLSAPDFYQTITPQPTILYTTPSNITGDRNRFRLVYVFEKALNDNALYRNEVLQISNCISSFIPDFKYDSTSLNTSQQMGGNGRDDCLIFKSYNLFNFSSFEKWKQCIPTTYKKEERDDISNRKADIYEDEDIEIIDNELIKDYWNIGSYDSAFNFLIKYRDRYPLFETTQVDEDIPYINLNDDYVEISRRYYVVKDEYYNNRSIPVKIKEGDREKTLFRNALLRLKIQPYMSFEHLLYAMVYERHYWINNLDGEFGNMKLYKIAKGAFTKRGLYDISTATIGQKRRRAKTNKNGYKVNKAFCDKYGVSVRTMANLMRGDISNEVLLENYDFDKSVKENSKLLKEKDITPNSERRLYQFKKWCIKNNILKNNCK